MGMFDDVNFTMPCPTCGAQMGNFQSKDGPCDLSTIEPDAVSNFYASCHKCWSWVEFTKPRPAPVAPRRVPLTLEQVAALGFEMHVLEKRASSDAEGKG